MALFEPMALIHHYVTSTLSIAVSPVDHLASVTQLMYLRQDAQLTHNHFLDFDLLLA